MVIYIDTREKKNAHIMSYFLRHGIVFQSKKLDCGDYWAEGSPVIIERKSSLLELAGNITKDGGKRISAELKRIPADKRLVLAQSADEIFGRGAASILIGLDGQISNRGAVLPQKQQRETDCSFALWW